MLKAADKTPKPTPPLRLSLGRSWWLTGLALGAHSGALGLLLVTPFSTMIRLALGAAVVISLLMTLELHGLRRARHAITGLNWDGQGQWTLHTKGGHSLGGRLLAGSYASPYLVILNFRTATPWPYRSLVILPDALDAAGLRRLRVYLKMLPAAHLVE